MKERTASAQEVMDYLCGWDRFRIGDYDADTTKETVISQKIPVPVVNASPASFNGALLPDLHLKGIQILLPMNDLKVENPIDHDTADTTHEDNQEKYFLPGRDKAPAGAYFGKRSDLWIFLLCDLIFTQGEI